MQGEGSIMTAFPEDIGEHHARWWYARVGGLLITRRQTYLQAVNALERLCQDPVAKQAFDRRLGQLVASTPGTLAQPPKRRRRA
jgi:hypothetical protein